MDCGLLSVFSGSVLARLRATACVLALRYVRATHGHDQKTATTPGLHTAVTLVVRQGQALLYPQLRGKFPVVPATPCKLGNTFGEKAVGPQTRHFFTGEASTGHLLILSIVSTRYSADTNTPGAKKGRLTCRITRKTAPPL